MRWTKPLLDVLDRSAAKSAAGLADAAGRALSAGIPKRAARRRELPRCSALRRQLAAEVTLQPIRRFGFDAAILFSDILVVPHALGQAVRFAEGEGPQLDADRGSSEVWRGLRASSTRSVLAPVYETIRQVKAQLAAELALLGFCGAPWTVATYMIAGHGTPGSGAGAAVCLSRSRRLSRRLIDRAGRASASYLMRAVPGRRRCGADIRYLGRRAAGARNSIAGASSRRSASSRKSRQRAPDAKIIGFPRGVGHGLSALCGGRAGRCRRARLDGRSRFCARADPMPRAGAGQSRSAGAASPAAPRSTGRSMRILEGFCGRPFIFNLGHGILPETPIAHVERMLARCVA